MPTRNVKLTDHHDHFVEQLINSGQYRNASEVMRAGLRLLEQESREDQEKLILLRRLATEAFRSLDAGEGTTLEGDQALEDFVRGVGQNGNGGD